MVSRHPFYGPTGLPASVLLVRLRLRAEVVLSLLLPYHFYHSLPPLHQGVFQLSDSLFFLFSVFFSFFSLLAFVSILRLSPRSLLFPSCPFLCSPFSSRHPICVSFVVRYFFPSSFLLFFTIFFLFPSLRYLYFFFLHSLLRSSPPSVCLSVWTYSFNFLYASM